MISNKIYKALLLASFALISSKAYCGNIVEDNKLFNSTIMMDGFYNLQKENNKNYELDTLTSIGNNGIRIRTYGDNHNGDIWGLYSRKASENWNIEAGIGSQYSDAKPYVNVGLSGLMPYKISSDIHFMNNNNLSHLYIETSRRFKIYHHLSIEPTLNILSNFKENSAMKTGLANAQFDLRTYYRASKKLSPYFSYVINQDLGDTRNMKKNNGEKTTNYMTAIGIKYEY